MQTNSATEKAEIRKKVIPFKQGSLFSSKNLQLAGLSSLVYLVLSYSLLGFKADQVVLVVLFNTLYFSSWATRRFILGFSIFIIYWIVFDYMKAFPNYRFNSVHIQDLYLWEKSWFGFEWNNQTVTPNEYFNQNNNPVVDFITGIFYLCWIPVPLAFAAVLFFKNRHLFFQFCLTFIAVNILGWIGYYSYPAAPPWYVAKYGFDFVAATPGNIAGFARFDDLVGVPIFESIYAKSSNVFAAMPSLHSAYIMIVTFYAMKVGMKWWAMVFAIVTIGIWFGAVYSSHHYIIDVVAGIICAVLGISLFRVWVKTKMGEKVIQGFVRITSK